MKSKADFSPWHTKENSFEIEEDEQCVIYQNFTKPTRVISEKVTRNACQTQRSGRKQQFFTKDCSSNCIVRSFSKTEAIMPSLVKEDTQNPYGGAVDFTKKKRVALSSQKSQRLMGDDSKTGREFDDEKWKMLAISSNDRFKSECAQLRKYQNFATQLKSRRQSIRSNFPISAQPFSLLSQRQKQKQKPILQEVSIKNFIIQGHYSDKDPLFQIGKRRQNSYVLKQKFATLKKTIDSKENNDPCGLGGKKIVVVRGNTKEKERENLFKVIKLEREVNNVNKGMIQNDSLGYKEGLSVRQTISSFNNCKNNRIL